MVGDLRDHGHFGPGARQNLGVDPVHVRGDELHQAIDGGVGRTEWDDDGHVRVSGLRRKGTQEDRNAMLHQQVRVP